MAEQAADFEWRGDGEAGEVVLYVPNPTVADWAFELALPATRLPGVMSPVYGAASSRGSRLSRSFGWVAASETHAAPDLMSEPERGLLLVTDAPIEGVGALEEVLRLVSRRLPEVTLPGVSDAEVRRISES